MSAHTLQADIRTKPHICWLGGWGIAPDAMQAIAQRLLPDASHSILPPTAASLEILHSQLTRQKQSATAQLTASHEALAIKPNNDTALTAPDIIAGYSTGAFLLLRDFALTQLQQAPETRLLLLAPFADFRMESGLGSKVATTRLKLLLRRLRSDPLAAVADFYLQSGVSLPAPEALPYAQTDLLWGIEQLAQTSICEQIPEKLLNNNLSLKTSAFIGAQDTLLDAEKIASLFAPGTCHVAQSASHDFASLLQAAIAEGGLLQ